MGVLAGAELAWTRFCVLVPLLFPLLTELIWGRHMVPLSKPGPVAVLYLCTSVSSVETRSVWYHLSVTWYRDILV